MNKNNDIKNLQVEVEILKNKLKISQSLVKIGFWELNRQTNRIMISPEAIQILKSNEKSDCSIEEFVGIFGGNQRPEVLNLENDLKSGIRNIDYEIILRPGTIDNEIWIKIIANSAATNIENPQVLIGIVQDITELKQNEKQLQKAKEKAEEADVLKSAFLANMSHEIRTPLNAILGFSRLLTNPEIDNLQRREYSEYITSSANNLLNLIRDIVDVSKIEAGKIEIENKVCPVNKILKELKITFDKEKEAQAKNQIEINTNFAFSGDTFSIITDPFRFHQIMVNLIGNALKFIENGFIEFGYLFINNEWLQFYVKDTGIGIPSDKIDLIFSRFGQIVDKKIKNPGGTGLGLSITKYLVERLGGKIWVDSQQGAGTTFYFTLPFKKAPEYEVDTSKVNIQQETIDFGNIKILAVEDDQINMILLEDTIKTHTRNVHVEKAFNGLEALEKLKSADFDLIIMDIRMPYMDGYEATKYIREMLPSPKSKIPILGLSAHALKNEIEKGKEIGMNDFLSKPIIPEELFGKLRYLLNKSIQEPVQSCINTSKDEPKVINLHFLQNIFKNNEVKILNTLKVYLDQIPNQLADLRKACVDNDGEKLKNISHSLKSTFRYLGRTDLSGIARSIELDFDPVSGQTEISELIIHLENEWSKIKEYINQRYFG